MEVVGQQLEPNQVMPRCGCEGVPCDILTPRSGAGADGLAADDVAGLGLPLSVHTMRVEPQLGVRGRTEAMAHWAEPDRRAGAAGRRGTHHRVVGSDRVVELPVARHRR